MNRGITYLLAPRAQRRIRTTVPYPLNLDERVRAWRAAAPAFKARQAKHLRQLREGWRRHKQLSFVFGCQRSGTKMLMRILDESTDTRIFHENNPLAFRDFELREAPVVRALAAAGPAPCQVFKPICDSHRADELLAGFPAARGIWIYRHYADVARSAVAKWSDHQRQVVDAIAAGDLDPWGWRTRDLPPPIIDAVRSVHRPDMSAYEGALLFWWVRNSFYFSRGLHEHPRLLLVRYEDLVNEPERTFPAVFEQVGARLEPRYLERVHAGSVRGTLAEEASPAIVALCEELLERLDRRAREPWTPPPVSPVMMLIDTLYVGGAERYVVTVSNWMARNGVEVIVAAQAAELEGELDPSITFEDTPIHHVRTGLPLAAARVARLIRRERPAAIVCHSLATTGIARIASAGTGVPVINVAHGWPADRYGSVARLMRAADKVIAVSPEVRAKLVEGGLQPERCQVIQNGIDVSPFGRREGALRENLRAELGVGPEDLLVLVVGRLTAQKAHHHVFAIAQRLGASHPGIRFAIAGTGDRAEELTELARSTGLEDRVLLLGTRRDIPDLMGVADIYLSTSDWEGMPLTTIEAMVSSLPCVATLTEGTALLLGDDCGLVVPVGDVGALSDSVARLADQPELRQRIGAAARARALERFSHDRVAQEILALLRRVIQGEA